MTETKNPGEKLTVTPPKSTLTLKRSSGVEQGVVRQSFSHGRTKAVVVEKVKRRIGPGETAKPAEAAPATAAPTARRTAPAPAAPAAAPAAPAAPAAAPAPAGAPKRGLVLPKLTEEERKARADALVDFRSREAEERKHAEEEAHRRDEREARERSERDAAEARKREEEDRRRHEDEAKRKAEQE